MQLSSHAGDSFGDWRRVEPTLDRFGRAVAHHLSAGTDALGKEQERRLENARCLALARRKPTLESTAPSPTWRLPWVSDLSPRNYTLASIALAVTLAVSIWVADMFAGERWASDAADVEIRLLTSKLPVAAFTDPGFAEFVRRAAAGRVGGDTRSRP